MFTKIAGSRSIRPSRPTAIEALKAVVAFAQMRDLQNATPELLRKIERKVQRVINRETPRHERWDRRDPSWQELEALRERADRLLSSLADRKAGLAGDMSLTLVAVQRQDGVHVEVLGPPLSLLLYQIVRVMEAVGSDRLLRCPACNRMFVSNTKGMFCSTRCRMRLYMREKRAAGQRTKRRK
jgi:hypothetical protein